MDHSAILAALEKGNFNQDIGYFSFHKHRYDFLLKKLERLYVEGKRFLEIGSLTGHLMVGAKLIGYQVAGTDLEKYVAKLQALSAHYSLDNRAADLACEPIPFEDNSFDVIVCSEVLEHLNFHPGVLFKELQRVLKSEGTLIVTTPNLIRLNNVLKLLLGKSINAEIEEPYTEGTHYREYAAAEICFLAQQTGLSVVSEEYRNFDYPNIGLSGKISDFLSSTLFPRRKRDICVMLKK